MEATLHYTEPLVRRAVWRFCLRVIGWLYPLAVLTVLIFFVSGVLRGDRSWQSGVSGAVLALGFLFPIVLFRNQLSAALIKFRALKGEPATFRASEQSYFIQSAAGSSELPWHTVTLVWRYEDFWLLLFSKAHFMTFPLAGVPPEVQAFVLERVRSSGGRVA